MSTKKAVGNSARKKFARNPKRYKLTIRSLSADYQNPHDVMLHSIFQVLVDFIEKEKPFEFVNWNSDDRHKLAAKTFKAAYKYWKVERPLLNKKEQEYTSKAIKGCGVENGLFYSAPGSDKWIKKYWDLEKKRNDLDKKHIIALAEVRGFMWT